MRDVPRALVCAAVAAPCRAHGPPSSCPLLLLLYLCQRNFWQSLLAVVVVVDERLCAASCVCGHDSSLCERDISTGPSSRGEAARLPGLEERATKSCGARREQVRGLPQPE